MDEDTISAALRVASAYETGVCPVVRDLWALQLSISMSDAADLLLGHEELARKIIDRQQPLCNSFPSPVRRSSV